MLANRHRTTGQRVAKARFIQLQIAVLHNNRVVLSNRSFRLDREHPVQIFAAALMECRTFLGRRFGELTIELGDVALAEKCIGLLKRVDSARRSSCGRRFCQVPKLRSHRPRACGE